MPRLRATRAVGSLAALTGALSAGLFLAGPAYATGPTAAGDPNTGLHDGTSVAVTGHGFTASATIYLTECANASGPSGCDTSHVGTTSSNATGDISTSFVVHTGTIGNGTCNAGSTNCTITVSDGTPAGTTTIPLSFASAGGATASGNPTTGLQNGSTVAVTGHNFTASTTIYLTECANSSGQSGCDVHNLVTTSSSASGDVSASFVVHTGTIGNGTCSPGSTSCFIAVSDGTAAGTVDVALSFAGGGAPTATATPSKGLTEGEKVALSGHGFAPSASVYLTECANTTGYNGCDPKNIVVAKSDANGDVSTTFTVHLGKIGNGTCTAKSTNCFIGMSGGTAANTAIIHVTFAQLPTTMTLKLAKSSVTSTQNAKLTVTVKAKGFVPTGAVTVLNGKKTIGSGKLGKTGKVVIKLAKQKAGSYVLKVKYAGSAAGKPSSKTIKLTVTS